MRTSRSSSARYTSIAAGAPSARAARCAAMVPALWFQVTGLLITDPAVAVVANAPMLVYMVFLSATVYIADYVSYRDVFHANETLAPLSRSGS